jgi:AcrR family transcriptional regulator
MDRKRIWLEEGFVLVIENGFAGFKVDVLCSKIKIAKTSFYHFFGSRELFLEELIRYWSSEKSSELLISLQKCAAAGSLPKFITHKKKFLSFYCFQILVKQYVVDNPELLNIVENIEDAVWQRTDDFVISHNPHEEVSPQMKSLIHTFLAGWDYLYAFKIYHDINARAIPIAELKIFLSNLINKSKDPLLVS